MKRDTEQKITVEDLIRLKRAERPPAEFWATFESQIRTKQLSAIVDRRPWWHRFSGILVMVNRHQLSFGAAAAFAMAFAGFRYVNSHPGTASAVTVSAPAPAAVAVIEAVPTPAAPLVVSAAAPATEVTTVESRESEAAPLPVVKATASHLTQTPVAIASDSLSKSPFADGISIKLSDFREPVSEYARPSVFGSDREFEPSTAPARAAVSEPLARMDPAAERRARLLAPALPAYSSGGSGTLAGDWMRQRASSDDRMYESMDRGSSDDRALVGFRF
jgi:hypothetical protein